MRTEMTIDVPFRTQQFVLLAAQTGSFHKAARILAIDHTVIIRSVDRLEKNLGVQIFHRSRNGFTVTDAGTYFLREIQSATHHVERACDLARYRDRIQQGPLRIGYSGYVHSRLIPILERMKMDPDNASSLPTETTIEFRSGTTPQLVDAVLKGELHAVFGVQPSFDEDLWVKSLTREPFSLCMSKNHRLARKPAILAKETDGEMVFLTPRVSNPAFYDKTVAYIESTGAKPIFREVMSFPHAMEIVSHSFGIAILPRSASRLAHPGVIFKPITDKLLWIETVLFKRRDLNSDRMQQFVDALLNQVRTLSVEP